MEMRYPPQEVLRVLERLSSEHYVEVRWIDACEIRDATERDVEQGFETPVKAIGRVYGVKKDYLILVVESSPVLGFRVLSIPIGCIRRIRVLTRKSSKKPLRVERSSQPYKLVYVYVKTGENSSTSHEISFG